jgi:tetratricopeptide (TPR) repeat protein
MPDHRTRGLLAGFLLGALVGGGTGLAGVAELQPDTTPESEAEQRPTVGELRSRLLGWLGNAPEDAEIERARAEWTELKDPATPDERVLIDAMLLSLAGDAKGAETAVESAVASNPEDADTHYAHGMIVLQRLTTEGPGLSSLSLAGKARSAWKRAIELDPEHASAHMALAMYYLNAPGIAGGDKKAAEDLGDALVAMGETDMGYTVLVQAALGRGKWSNARERLDEWVAKADERSSKRNAYAVYLIGLVLTEEKTKDAFEVLPLFEALCLEDDATPHYLWGRALVMRGDRGDTEAAIDRFSRAIAISPDARNSRWYLAEALRKRDHDREAARHYEAFAERFPDDDRAKEATKLAAKLRR